MKIALRPLPGVFGCTMSPAPARHRNLQRPSDNLKVESTPFLATVKLWYFKCPLAFPDMFLPDSSDFYADKFKSYLEPEAPHAKPMNSRMQTPLNSDVCPTIVEQNPKPVRLLWHSLCRVMQQLVHHHQLNNMSL